MRRRVQRGLSAALRPVGFHDANPNTILEGTQVENLCYGGVCDGLPVPGSRRC
jgi:hypothetical protein